MLLGLWWALRRCAYYSRLLRFPATMRSNIAALGYAAVLHGLWLTLWRTLRG